MQWVSNLALTALLGVRIAGLDQKAACNETRDLAMAV